MNLVQIGIASSLIAILTLFALASASILAIDEITRKKRSSKKAQLRLSLCLLSLIGFWILFVVGLRLFFPKSEFYFEQVSPLLELFSFAVFTGIAICLLSTLKSPETNRKIGSSKILVIIGIVMALVFRNIFPMTLAVLPPAYLVLISVLSGLLIVFIHLSMSFFIASLSTEKGRAWSEYFVLSLFFSPILIWLIIARLKSPN